MKTGMIRKPLNIVLLYLAISLTWILVSDHMVHTISLIVGIPADNLQTGKGLLFVSATALLLFYGIKLQQNRLIKNAEQYKSLFHSNPNPLWIYDIDTLKFLEVNETAIKAYGYSRDEFKSMIVLDIIPHQEHSRFQKLLADGSESSTVCARGKHLTKGGQPLDVDISSHKIRFNNQNCSMVMALDVTVRLMQEEKLELSYQIEKELREQLEINVGLLKQSLESKRKLAEVVDRINNMVMITDPQGAIIWVNHAFEKFTGYSLGEVIGRSSDFLHGARTEAKTQSLIMESIQKTDFATFEILNYTKSQQEYWVELNISAIYGDDGQILRYISIQSIITERKRREEKIQEQNEILRQQAWINSHAIRKPLASILSLVGLSKDMDNIAELKEVHSLIDTSSQELDLIVRNINKAINACEEQV